EATAPAAMTPLMKPRRETDREVSSDILLSSIAGSPRRVGNRPRGEGFGPAHDNPVGASGAMIFRPVSRCLRLSPRTSPYDARTMQLTFLGAAGTVTGSKHLLEVNGHRILIDCGLFQGLKEARQRNWDPLPVSPASIDAVVLTHAHLD